MVKIKISNNWYIVLIIFLISSLFLLVEVLQKKEYIKSYIENFSKENENLKKNIVKQKKLLELYKTNKYKDLYAKENLSLFKEGEKILLIEEEFEKNIFDFYDQSGVDNLKNISAKKQWEKYFNF